MRLNNFFHRTFYTRTTTSFVQRQFFTKENCLTLLFFIHANIFSQKKTFFNEFVFLTNNILPNKIQQKNMQPLLNIGNNYFLYSLVRYRKVKSAVECRKRTCLHREDICNTGHKGSAGVWQTNILSPTYSNPLHCNAMHCNALLIILLEILSKKSLSRTPD